MDRTASLIQKAHEGDKQARERLAEENMGLVRCVAKRFCGRGTDMEDLFQIGSIGLLKAIDRFDLSYGVKFSTYAVPMISGEIKRFLRDDGMIKVSRSLKELSCKIFRAREEAVSSSGREPTVDELCKATGAGREEIVQAMEASGGMDSLYRPLARGDGQRQELELMDRLKEREGKEDRIIDRILLMQLLGRLDRDERRLIYMRYYLEETQARVGEKLGISQVQVSRMEKKIIQRLRKIGEEGIAL